MDKQTQKELKQMINKNKNLIVLAIILVIVLIVALVITAIKSNDNNSSENIIEDEETVVEEQTKEAPVSEIEAGELPAGNELSSLGLDDVVQAKHITEQFNLYMYEETDDGMRYSYLANKVTSGERLYVYTKAMSEQEYNEMLPTKDTAEVDVNGIKAVFNGRSLYYTTDESEVSENTRNSEKEGNIVIRYGNTTTEVLPMQQLMWYDNGIAYTLESINRYYTADDMAKLANAFYEASEEQ